VEKQSAPHFFEAIMIRATSAALLLFLLTLTGMTLWLGAEAHKLLVHLDGATTRAEGIETKANATLMNLDKGTAVWAASAKDQAKAITDLATDAHGTLSQVNAVIFSLDDSAHSLNNDLTALHKTTDAATSLTVALTQDAQTANVTIAAAQPVLQGFTRDSEDLDALLKDNAIHQTLDNVSRLSGNTADTMENVTGITADIHKETTELVRPRTRKEKIVGYLPTALKLGMIAGCIATGTTCP
jgi:hypothetical protein